MLRTHIYAHLTVHYGLSLCCVIAYSVICAVLYSYMHSYLCFIHARTRTFVMNMIMIHFIMMSVRQRTVVGPGKAQQSREERRGAGHPGACFDSIRFDVL